MKKLVLALILLSVSLKAQTTTSLINLFVRCPTTSNYFLMSISGTISCVLTPSNITISGNPPAMTITTPPYTPQQQVESIPLSTLVSTATTITYTTKQTPVGGVVWWYYQGTDFSLNNSGAISLATTPNPITFTLPSNWQATDNILIVYQSK